MSYACISQTRLSIVNFIKIQLINCKFLKRLVSNCNLHKNQINIINKMQNFDIIFSIKLDKINKL